MALFKQRQRTLRSKAGPVALALAFALGNLFGAAHIGLGLPSGVAQTQAAPMPDGGGQARLGQPVVGKLVQLPWSKTPPTPSTQERQAQQAAQAQLAQLKVPVGPVHHMTPAETAALARTAGPPLPTPRTASHAGPQADSTFDVELNTPVSSAGFCGSCSAASTLSPSVANDGQDLWMTGNYYAARSTNNGTTWSALDPYAEAISITNRFFVGSQQVLYEPSRDTFFWSLGAANSPGGAISAIGLVTQAGNLGGSACGREFDPQTLGVPSASALLNPDIEYSANYLYLSFDAFNGASFVSSDVARLPLSALAPGNGCGSMVPQVVSRTDNFHFTLAQGATNIIYWDSNDYLSGPTTGNHVRVFFWPESSTSYTYLDKQIDPFTFLAVGGGSQPNCGSQDGVVTDWCLNLDSTKGTLYRSRAGYRGFGAPLLGMAWGAGPTNGISPFPYVVRYYFFLANMAYKGHDQIYNANYAVAWPSLAAPVQRGYVGGTFTYGGGTGTGGSAMDFYPANGLLIEDPDTPSQPWATDLFTGSGNLAELGVYNTARAWAPDGLHWIAAGEGGASVMAIVPYVVVFGRGRDHLAYLRWANT